MSNFDKTNPQLNLKNVDTSKIAETLTEHQNSLIKLILVVGALIIAGFMFNDLRMKDQVIRAKMSQAQDKLDVIKARDTAVQNLDDFKASLPKKLNEFELISLISNFARSYDINIASLAPAESKDMGLYDLIDVSFNATADNFKNMMLFLKIIEKSKFPLRINSWSGHEVADGKINFTIEISAVLIHT